MSDINYVEIPIGKFKSGDPDCPFFHDGCMVCSLRYYEAIDKDIQADSCSECKIKEIKVGFEIG